jgi:HNH endonuclease
MRSLHIVHGHPVHDKKRIENLARRDPPTVNSWIVPKTAAPGDDVIIYVRGYGFFATARINSKPTPRTGWNRRYGASLVQIRLINPPISLHAIHRSLPKLMWANYPRSITTPTRALASQIHLLVRRRRETELPDLDNESLEKASLEELKAVALLSARAVIPGTRRSVIVRARSVAIRSYILKLANGICQGCRQPGPFLTTDGVLYLEPHHTLGLAEGGPDHPEKVIAVCPNCHKRAHHSQDAKQFNRSLIKKLAILNKRLGRARHR